MTCGCLPTHWPRTTPSSKLDASHISSNGCSQFGAWRISVEFTTTIVVDEIVVVQAKKTKEHERQHPPKRAVKMNEFIPPGQSSLATAELVGADLELRLGFGLGLVSTDHAYTHPKNQVIQSIHGSTPSLIPKQPEDDKASHWPYALKLSILCFQFDSEKCEALKRLLALIVQGFDVSNFFPQVPIDPCLPNYSSLTSSSISLYITPNSYLKPWTQPR
ncbi:hypothetical protein CR513_09831, partial [Mucuna pruriens]